jgi:hypothetical protein
MGQPMKRSAVACPFRLSAERGQARSQTPARFRGSVSAAFRASLLPARVT